MSYNPKITPLSITVGPAASYHEPPEPPGATQVSQITQIRQVQQPPPYSQQPLTVIGKRNNCNKSCLVAILLIIACVIISLTLLAAWFWGAFDNHGDKERGRYGRHATKMPIDYSHKCPQYYLMYNGKCDEGIYMDWR